MRKRPYYSARTGKNPDAIRYELPLLRRLFLATYQNFLARDYFQEMLGKDCVDASEPPAGTAGYDVDTYVFRHLRKPGLWPIEERHNELTEDDVFDLIEFLYDHVSKGIEGYYHSYSECGWHYSTFDSAAGRTEFRDAVNDFLRDYKEGFELSVDGEILQLPEAGFDNLFVADLPGADPQSVRGRVEAATLKFRRRTSKVDDRRDAVRDLADVLEFLRPQLKDVFNSKDESDLFNLANNFAIRHHNPRQQTNYDPNIWLSWMFYFYLATIHAAVRLIERKERAPTK